MNTTTPRTHHPRIRAGAISEGTTSARTINRAAPMTADPYNLHKVHRVDAAYLTDSHARMVAGTYEQRPAQPRKPLAIDVAVPDADEGQGREADDLALLSARDLIIAISIVACILLLATIAGWLSAGA